MGRKRVRVDDATREAILTRFDEYCVKRTREIPAGTSSIRELIAADLDLPTNQVRSVINHRDSIELDKLWKAGCAAIKDGKEVEWSELFPKAYLLFLENLYYGDPIGPDQKWSIKLIFDNVKKGNDGNNGGVPEFPV